MQALFGGHAFGGIGFARIGGFVFAFEKFDITLERVGAAVEDQVFGAFPFFGGDFGIRFDLGGVDDGHIQPGFDAVVEHDRVQGGAGGGREAKRQVRNTQRGEHTRQALFNQPDTLNGFDGRGRKFGVAGGQGEGQIIENQGRGRQAVFVDRHMVDALRHFQLTLTGFGHALFIDGQDDDGGVVFLGQPENLVGFFAPGFEVGRVDQTASRRGFQPQFEHVQFGGIENQRQVDPGGDQFAQHLAHQERLIPPFGDGHGNIQRMCAVVNLFLGDGQDGVPIFGQQQTLKGAAALSVAAFANQEGRRVLLHIDGLDPRSQFGGFWIGTGRVLVVVQLFDE